jgi:hypothetical protein
VKLTRDELLDVLMDELRALTIWRSAKLPKDVELGVGISIDKITAALKQCGRVRSDPDVIGALSHTDSILDLSLPSSSSPSLTGSTHSLAAPAPGKGHKEEAPKA